jgi:hypothetical protein
VQQAKKSTAKPETHRTRYLWLELKGSVVELQLIQSISESRIVIRIDWEQPTEHLRFYLCIPRQCLNIVSDLAQRDGVTHTRILQKGPHCYAS